MDRLQPCSRHRPAIVAALIATTTLSAVAASPPVLASVAILPSALCGGFPTDVRVVVAGNGQVGIEGAGSTPLGPAVPAAASLVLRGPDGTVWAADLSTDASSNIVRVPSGSSPTTVASGQVSLLSAGWVTNRSAALILDRSDASRPDGLGGYGAVLVDFADGEQADLGPVGEGESSVRTLTIGPDRLVESDSGEYSESISFRTFDGLHLDGGFSPTDSAAFNAPPLYQWPIVALGGATADSAVRSLLSWVEGPDFDGATQQSNVGGWALVVADSVTGAESLRLDLGHPGVNLSYADFDGRFWIGTFEDASGDPDAPQAVLTPARVLVVDTAAATPAVVDAGCPTGVTASLDRLGQAASSAPPVVAANTTVAAPAPTAAPPPSTPAPAPTCSSYTPAPDQYPIRRCESGPAVFNVQIRLVEAGYSVDVDGYFGPGTEAVVRWFQTDRGLEVDGLVGPNTWAALAGSLSFDPVLDVDGNGVFDPWEIPAGE